MIQRRQVGLVIMLIVIGVGVIIYFFFSYSPPADSGSDRIAFIAWSSFPGLSALFLQKSIYVINVNSPGLTHITQQPELDLGLTWSPRGDKIAYYDYGSRSLYTTNANGSGQPELVQSNIFVVDMDWSPDSSEIVYSDGVGGIYILNLTTKRVTSLDEVSKGAEPDWSPSGNKIVFTLNPYSDGPDSSIAIVNRDGSGLVQLTPDNNSRSPKWSPDGNAILFERNRNIYIVNVDGTSIKALLKDGNSYMPSWSPDRTRIAFVSVTNQKCSGSFLDAPRFCTNELRVMDSDGSNMRTIRNKKNERYMFPVWAPRN